MGQRYPFSAPQCWLKGSRVILRFGVRKRAYRACKLPLSIGPKLLGLSHLFVIGPAGMHENRTIIDARGICDGVASPVRCSFNPDPVFLDLAHCLGPVTANPKAGDTIAFSFKQEIMVRNAG
jgi:hypothetical protein